MPSRSTQRNHSNAATAPELRFRIRVIHAGVVAIGPGKVALLETLARTGSISAAARNLGMSYRRAWLLIDEMNATVRKPVVHTATGGAGGGGAGLTPAGEEIVAVYRRIEKKAAKACSGEIRTLLGLVGK